MYLAVLQHYDVRMASLQDLRKRLKPGGVYRRSELTHRAKSIDRHLNQLVKEGALQRVSRGLYYYPRTSVFGVIPPDESALVEGFLNSKSFLVTSPNAYNGLGVGTTQLYNKKIIYNRRRNGEFKLGNRTFEFRKRLYFPKSLTPEFLLVDLVNNLNTLAEDHDVVLKYVAKKVYGMDKEVIRRICWQVWHNQHERIFLAIPLNSLEMCPNRYLQYLFCDFFKELRNDSLKFIVFWYHGYRK